MANVICNVFKEHLLKGNHNFSSSGGNTYKLALYTSSKTVSASAVTGYNTTNEAANASGSGYTAAGNTLTNNGVAIASNVAFVDFADSTFSSVTLSATGALIYKGSSNEAVLVLDFGGTKTATNGDFVVQFPTADSSNAIIRLGDA